MQITSRNYTIYWGAMPLPAGATPLGTIKRDNGDTGALIRLANGNYVQGNAGGIRTLPQHDVDAALQQHNTTQAADYDPAFDVLPD